MTEYPHGIELASLLTSILQPRTRKWKRIPSQKLRATRCSGNGDRYSGEFGSNKRAKNTTTKQGPKVLKLHYYGMVEV